MTQFTKIPNSTENQVFGSHFIDKIRTPIKPSDKLTIYFERDKIPFRLYQDIIEAHRPEGFYKWPAQVLTGFERKVIYLVDVYSFNIGYQFFN